MRDNKELFDFLNIKEDGAEAKNINALDAALNMRLNAAAPSGKVMSNIMAAAEKRNTSAIKKFFSAFTFRRVLAGAALIFLLVAAPRFIHRQEARDQNLYAYAAVYELEEVDNGLEYIFTGLDYMEENI